MIQSSEQMTSCLANPKQDAADEWSSKPEHVCISAHLGSFLHAWMCGYVSMCIYTTSKMRSNFLGTYCHSTCNYIFHVKHEDCLIY